ncbi:hypothetical protein ACH5RR_006324 [Cinchona calisaya]|uniref:Auxin-responsive protein n=1 Tax=Cinchona calisaya TaxID=153742 RepID=A0ABD3AP03_9GENT
MNNLDSHRQESLKMRWQEKSHKNNNTMPSSHFYSRLLNGGANPSPLRASKPKDIQLFPGGFDDDLVSTVVPPVTVVLEGRSICQRISLDKHTSYQSLATALRQMFVDGDAISGVVSENDQFELSNAIPGHRIAYEDIENDLLLVGDLKWK